MADSAMGSLANIERISRHARLPTKTAALKGFAIAAVAVAAGLLVAHNLEARPGAHAFVNVSYDPTRELYRDINAAFTAQHAGDRLELRQSHGGSSRQARAVIAGAPADVVTLAMHSDIEALRKRGLIAAGWSARLPNDSLPYTSTIVFVVRRGNPHHIHDFPDLIAPGVAIVTPNPKTSGNGKLSFLAAWGSVVTRGGSERDARAFVAQIYQHVAVLDDGARAASLRFAQEKLGDVHVTWENEALLEASESGGELELVHPPTSIRAEPYVAWVDANVKRNGSEALARAYLEFLYTDQAQALIAKHGYRPISPAALARASDRLPAMQLFPITAIARDWEDAQRRFFDDDAIFDAIARPRQP